MAANVCACGAAILKTSKRCRPCSARILRSFHTPETAKRRRAGLDPGPHRGVCEYCRVEFVAKTDRARFCSGAHYMRHKRIEEYVSGRPALKKEVAHG
jgi:hypothetical protein